jgi:hypothetical protein
VTALAVILIATLSLVATGLGLLAVVALRRASRRVDQILAEELGHRGAHENYDTEIRAWRATPRDYV